MTVTRSLTKVGTIAGADHVPDVSDILAAIWENIAGTASNVAGTNTVTFDLPVETGLSALATGMRLNLEPANTNTGAVTFEVSGAGIGAKAVVDAAGNALTGGELVAGTIYEFVFLGGADDHWRLIGASAGGGSTANAGYPPVRWYIFTATGADSLTIPYDCYAYIHLIGAGGGGAFGSSATRGGGGGGAYSFKRQRFDESDVITLSLGAGGADGSTGSDGGATTAVCAAQSVSMSAGGGKGGSGSAGGDGGAASGGDVNFTGGSGGTAQGAGGGGVDLTGQSLADAPDTSAGDGGGLPEGLGLPGLLSGGVGLGDPDTGTPGGHFCGGGGASGGASINDGGNGGKGGGGGAGVGGGGSTGGNGGDGYILIGISEEIT